MGDRPIGGFLSSGPELRKGETDEPRESSMLDESADE
jgi:hypothetical protein